MSPEKMIIARLDRIIQLMEYQMGIEHAEPADGISRVKPENPNHDR
jgi:hypothetical protein